ncbi:MAG: NnrS family protein [Caldimonas sp.]|uniref:NnrS family protein n=1 Tax=Caldimonas sp. TaxID=2838790 RepID=UPI00391D9A30
MRTVPIQPEPAGPAAAPRRTGPAPAWRASWLLAAPHRLGFFAGAVMLSTSAVWWLIVLASRQGLVPPLSWTLSPTLAHALLMSHGFMPLFITGFLFTAGPKWLGLPPVGARSLLAPTLACLSGWAVFLMGVHGLAPLAAIGLSAVAWGWSGFTRRYLQLLHRATAQDRTHARVVGCACLVGSIDLWAAVAGLMLGEPGWTLAAASVGLWWFIAPIYAAVLHRMIPFFTTAALPVLDAWRPMWLLWTWLAVLVAQPPLAWAARGSGPLTMLAIGFNLVAGLGALWLAVRWGLVQSLRIRLLAMLHLGFVWLGLALLLQAAAQALWWLGGHALGLAPLHALTLGFLGSVLLAMATRVSCGHGGRVLAADDIAWALFWGLQVAVVLRLLGTGQGAASGALVLASAVVWAAVALGWSWRYGRWFGRPRADGRPG